MNTYEDITFFPFPETPLPYSIEMAGRSFCGETYHIRRNPSTVYVFEYVIKGTGIVKHNDKVFRPCKGDVYILKANYSHDYYADPKDPWEKLWFNVRGELVDHLLEDYSLMYTSLIPEFNNSALFEEFLQVAKDRSLSHQEIFSKTAVILHQLVQQLYEKSHPSYFEKAEAAKIKKYIDQHLDEMIALETLSKLVFRSPSRVIKIFKEAYGQTPYDYILKKKMEIAQILLKNSSLTIKEISSQIGFCDEHYFSNYFKKRYGLSPKDYRKNT